LFPALNLEAHIHAKADGIGTEISVTTVEARSQRVVAEALSTVICIACVNVTHVRVNTRVIGDIEQVAACQVHPQRAVAWQCQVVADRGIIQCEERCFFNGVAGEFRLTEQSFIKFIRFNLVLNRSGRRVTQRLVEVAVHVYQIVTEIATEEEAEIEVAKTESVLESKGEIGQAISNDCTVVATYTDFKGTVAIYIFEFPIAVFIVSVINRSYNLTNFRAAEYTDSRVVVLTGSARRSGRVVGYRVSAREELIGWVVNIKRIEDGFERSESYTWFPAEFIVGNKVTDRSFSEQRLRG
jgi:hypothetical protein